MADIRQVISDAIADAGRYPFLFIGSGLSRRYANAPDWESLLRALCTTVLGDDFSFAAYRARARSIVQSDDASALFPQLASCMERDVNDALLLEPRFCDFREHHAAAIARGSSPMKLYVADLLAAHSFVPCAEADLLARAGKEKISGVITTNYDVLCETLFPGFTVFVGEGDLLFSEQGYAQEIYKVHGSVSDPDTMVLTSADYDVFARRRKYLAAKLLTIFVEYPVIFLGYSIQDQNIRAILEDICECLPASKAERLARRLVFVQYGPGDEVGISYQAFGDKTLMMTRVVTEDFTAIYEALLAARKTYDVRLLRELRGSVFSLAEKIDPTSEIVVSGIDNVLNSLGPDEQVVIGLARTPAGVGKPITPEDIIEDVVLDNLHYDPKFIVENYLNDFVRTRPNSMPVFKYVRDLGGEVGKDIARYLPTLVSIDSFRNKTMRKARAGQRKRFEGSLSVAGLERACAPNKPYAFIPYLEEDEIDVDELGRLLQRELESALNAVERKKILKNTDFRKCVRIYDFLRYRQEEPKGSPPTFPNSSETITEPSSSWRTCSQSAAPLSAHQG